METSEWIQKILAKLGIKAGPEVTPEDAMELIEPIAKKLAVEAVDNAIAASMLFADERDEMIEFAEDEPLAFAAFLKVRGPVKAQVSLLARIKSASSAKAQMTQADRETSRKLGVSEETFLKQNASSAPSGMSELERQVARQVGLSDAQFLKYNPPANR